MVRTRTFGGETSDITLTQGGYNKGGVAASAGTHDGGGVCGHRRVQREQAHQGVPAARCGHVASSDDCPACGRPTCHGIVCGDGTASAGAKAQVNEYYAGRNGLANRAKDDGWRLGVLPILFKFDGDLTPRYCTTRCHVYDEPTARAQEPRAGRAR